MEAGLLVGEVCHFYGWRLSDVLTMPASQFFVMLEASRTLSSQAKVEQCYIARTPAVTKDGFDEIVGYFSGLQARTRRRQVPVSQEVEPPNREMEKYAVMTAFASDTTINRRMH